MVVPELNCCALDSFRLSTVSSPQIEEEPFKCRATPGKQLEKVVYEATKLRRSAVGQQGIIRGGSAQSGTVNLFDESVGAINGPDMRTKTDAGQICSAAPAENRRNSRSAAGKWLVFAIHRTTVSERALVNMTKERGREGPLPTSVHIALLGDAGCTKGIASPFLCDSAGIHRKLL
jgi:hypothetical protein